MIVGERVRLRGLEKNDLPAFVRWLNDIDVRRHLDMNIPLSIGQEEKWYTDMLNRPISEHPLCIEVKDSVDWVFVGNIAFIGINDIDRSAEIGIMIGEKRFWSKGYGTETMRLMLQHGFDNLNLNRIFLRVYETNPRGKRCYEKAGFSLEGTMREARFLDGKYINVYLMSILKSEWNSGKNGGSE